MDAELLLWIAVFVALIVAAPLLRQFFTSGFDERRYAHTSLAEVRRMNWRGHSTGRYQDRRASQALAL